MTTLKPQHPNGLKKARAVEEDEPLTAPVFPVSNSSKEAPKALLLLPLGLCQAVSHVQAAQLLDFAPSSYESLRVDHSPTTADGRSTPLPLFCDTVRAVSHGQAVQLLNFFFSSLFSACPQAKPHPATPLPFQPCPGSHWVSSLSCSFFSSSFYFQTFE